MSCWGTTSSVPQEIPETSDGHSEIDFNRSALKKHLQKSASLGGKYRKYAAFGFVLGWGCLVLGGVLIFLFKYTAAAVVEVSIKTKNRSPRQLRSKLPVFTLQKNTQWTLGLWKPSTATQRYLTTDTKQNALLVQRLARNVELLQEPGNLLTENEAIHLHTMPYKQNIKQQKENIAQTAMMGRDLHTFLLLVSFYFRENLL